MRLKSLQGKSIILVLSLLLLVNCGSGDMRNIANLSHSAGDLLKGQIIGSASTARTIRVQATVTPRFNEPPAQQIPGYDEYVSLEDDTGALYVEVPAAWDDVDTSPLMNDQGEVFAASIKASTNIDSFDNSYDVPGVHLIAFRMPDPNFVVDDLLDEIDFEGCQYEGREDYQDNLYTGKYDRYVGCNGEYSNLTVVAAMPPEGDFVILVVVQATSEADIEAGNRIANTFQVTGELPELQDRSTTIGQD